MGSASVDEYQTFGDALVTAGCLSDQDLVRVTQMRASSGDDTPLPALLVRLGLVSETDIANQLAALYELPLATSRDFDLREPYFRTFSRCHVWLVQPATAIQLDQQVNQCQ